MYEPFFSLDGKAKCDVTSCLGIGDVTRTYLYWEHEGFHESMVDFIDFSNSLFLSYFFRFTCSFSLWKRILF